LYPTHPPYDYPHNLSTADGSRHVPSYHENPHSTLVSTTSYSPHTSSPLASLAAAAVAASAAVAETYSRWTGVDDAGIGSTNRLGVRKIVSTKRVQDAVVRSAIARKKSTAGTDPPPTAQLRSSTSTSDLTLGEGPKSEDGETPLTVCTNCQTTNTPLWRRDPEGQPLCKWICGALSAGAGAERLFPQATLAGCFM
jgi:hypothetical protein